MDETVPSVFVDDYNDGIQRVKEGGYAFLMESTMLDYVVQVKYILCSNCSHNPVKSK